MKTDIHKLMENAVMLYLIINGYRVYVEKSNSHEIDFIAVKNGQKLYVQVCLQLVESQMAEREFGNLLAIDDNFPKYVVILK
jgi:hypothetical protein